jgi:hypothetical protein
MQATFVAVLSRSRIDGDRRVLVGQLLWDIPRPVILVRPRFSSTEVLCVHQREITKMGALIFSRPAAGLVDFDAMLKRTLRRIPKRTEGWISRRAFFNATGS